MMKNPKTKQEAATMLKSGCEQSVACLNELVAIHFTIDPPNRVIQPTDAECVFRLRKVLLHVKALTSWQFDTDIMHIIAPELRAANYQIGKIWKKTAQKILVDYLEDEDKRFAAWAQPFAKVRQEVVSSYIHPTPQRLLLPGERGGLGKVNEVRYFYNMFVLLDDLVFRYGVSLIYLSRLLNGKNEAGIVLALGKMETKFSSMSPKDCLAFE